MFLQGRGNTLVSHVSYILVLIFWHLIGYFFLISGLGFLVTGSYLYTFCLDFYFLNTLYFLRDISEWARASGPVFWGSKVKLVFCIGIPLIKEVGSLKAVEIVT